MTKLIRFEPVETAPTLIRVFVLGRDKDGCLEVDEIFETTMTSDAGAYLDSIIDVQAELIPAQAALASYPQRKQRGRARCFQKLMDRVLRGENLPS